MTKKKSTIALSAYDRAMFKEMLADSGPKKKKKLDKNIVTHKGKRMTTEEANVQHYQDQVRQAYADYEEKSKKGRDPL